MAIVRAVLLALACTVPAAEPVPAAGSVTAETRPPFEVGRPFPLILLPSAADGRPLSLADFRGRKTLLHVFASW